MNQRLKTIMARRVVSATLGFVLLTLTAFAVLQSQTKAPAQSQDLTKKKASTENKFDETQFPTVEEYAFKQETKEERAKSERKAKRFQMVAPASSNFGVVAGVHHWPTDFSALPVAESTTILIGEVISATAKLSDDRMAVYSDFTIKPVTFLKDPNHPAESDSLLIASRNGGRIKFQNGHTLLVFDSGLGMPRAGRRYLFFLKQTDADFELLTAYEITNEKVSPIDSGSPNFDAYENIGEADIIKAVLQKIESLSKPLPTNWKAQ